MIVCYALGASGSDSVIEQRKLCTLMKLRILYDEQVSGICCLETLEDIDIITLNLFNQVPQYHHTLDTISDYLQYTTFQLSTSSK